ncbi:MAG: M15 family metallopeptidase [Ferruginibacter sp.]|nr:M15 family metallopeptidase [Ferruginibacter sp.]
MLYKIIIRLQKLHIVLLVFLCTQCTAYGQDTVLNKYGLWVISKWDDLQKTVQHNPSKQMVDIKKHIPNLVLDLKYASNANFMKIKFYPSLKTTYLRKEAADALKKVQKELNEQGLGLKIFDAYRPYSVTEKMWASVKDDRYAADPKKGSGHNRGVAIDLTIILLETKEELNMGTGFDNFSDTAHIDFFPISDTIYHTRLWLKNAMERNGFKALDTEWWHYYLPNAKEYELLDITFNELKRNRKLKKKKQY